MTDRRVIAAFLRAAKKQGYSQVAVERVLELPFGTIDKWKKGNFTSADRALATVLTNLPWMLDVAENKYNAEYANRRFTQALMEKKK